MGLESGQGDTGAAGGGAEAASRDTASSADPPPEIDLRRLARDWITLWESEITALAADPEMREAWQATASVWAGAMTAALRAMPRGSTPWPFTPQGHEQPPRGAGPTDAPRAAPATPAPDPRDAEIDRLARHIDALERRLADLERGNGDHTRRAAPRGRGRKPRPAG